MISKTIITSDKQARDVTTAIEQISQSLSSEELLKSIVDGLPGEVVSGVLRALSLEKAELLDVLSSYIDAKEGNADRLRERAGNDLGSLFVVARIARGWSQKELARRLFLPEQQVQRYEMERYRSISLGGLIRVARTLGVKMTAELPSQFQEQWLPSYEMSQADAQKVLKHARSHGWLDKNDVTDDNGLSQLKRTVAEHVSEHGTPSLLRTGLNVERHAEDWLLLAWKAQVTRRAVSIHQRKKVKYNPLAINWLKDLVRLSVLDNGPALVPAFLASHGIIFVYEPQIVGMNVDGAAFLIDDLPIIGLTLRYDRLDNFWFTLAHELAHVILHHRTGLAAGFFDNIENSSIEEIEFEANKFAGNLLIPDEIWIRSPARITKSPEPIEKLAAQIGISSSIIFGRVRMERNNYTIFSNKIGAGKVRKLFQVETSEVVL